LQPTGQKVNLGNLPDYRTMVAREFQALENLPSLSEARLLSARAFDESQVAGPRTYMAVQRYLGVARDNHEALLALLQAPRREPVGPVEPTTADLRGVVLRNVDPRSGLRTQPPTAQ
jgi:hypothetical protein